VLLRGVTPERCYFLDVVALRGIAEGFYSREVLFLDMFALRGVAERCYSRKVLFLRGVCF
jgi:hypothetical protein